MLNLDQRPAFIKMQKRRFVLGFSMIILKITGLYFLLSIHFQYDLDSLWGIHLTLQPWDGTGWLKWLILIAPIFSVLLFQERMSALLSKTPTLIQLYPRKEDTPEFYCGFQTSILVEETLSLAQKMEVSLQHIFVGSDPYPNAFTAKSFRRGDYIILLDNLLEILDFQSVQSVIGHELGHVKSSDSRLRVLGMMPQLDAKILSYLLLIQVSGVVAISESLEQLGYRILALAGTAVLLLVVNGLMLVLDQQYAYCQERLADAYGAFYTSPEGSMNGLLRLNERSHTLDNFLAAMRLHHRSSLSADIQKEALELFPRGSKKMEDIIDLAPLYYIQAHLNIISQKLSLKMTKEEKQAMAAQLLSRQELDTPLTGLNQLQELPFLWKDFDWNQDETLERRELWAMIETLKQHSDSLREDGTQHPSIRDRLLFLAEVFHSEFVANSSKID